MNLVKRNAEIVALVKARKMTMREIAARYRLSTSSISLIALRHGVHAQAADPKKVQAASKLIQRGMPLRHVAQTVGLDYQRLRHLLEKQGVYKVPPPNGRPGASARCASCEGITANRDTRCTPSLPSSVALGVGRIKGGLARFELAARISVMGKRRRQAQAHGPSAGRSTQPARKRRYCPGDRTRLQRVPFDHHAVGTHHTSLIPNPDV